VANWFHDNIVETNRLPLFCIFAGMLVGFLFIRFSVRMIRAQVKWWPGNVKPGGMHIHHVVFGVIFMMLAGVGGFALPDRALVGLCITGSLFGIGAALVLDEFALILHLDDVYWTEDGRKSVEVVVVTAALLGLMLSGFSPFGVNDVSDREAQDRASAIVTIVLNFLFVLLALSKGKARTAVFGVIVPFIALIGAVRLAKPASPWARRFYRRRPRARARSRLRAYRHDRRWAVRARRVQEWIGGKPDPAPARSLSDRR
jgi:hypothetical protein